MPYPWERHADILPLTPPKTGQILLSQKMHNVPRRMKKKIRFIFSLNKILSSWDRDLSEPETEILPLIFDSQLIWEIHCKRRQGPGVQSL